jgi:hypothetical protein
MLSKEVQAAVDEIHRERDVIVALRKADEVRDQQLADLRNQVEGLKSKSAISDEDSKALLDAIADSQGTNRDLAAAVPANTAATDPNVGTGSGQPILGGKSDRIAPFGSDGHPTEALTEGEVLGRNGPANHPAGGTVPLMPNMAFNPDPTGARGVGDGSQPNQPAAIETAGGFVVSGGGTTQRAPGTMPESPSSTLVAPLDPDAKGPASTADVVKSGVGDSSENALKGADGRPIGEGEGMPSEPSQYAKDEAQRLADLAAKEKQARADNPLNLAPAGTPQAGSPEAEKAAQKRREDEQREAVAKEQARNDAEQGKPAPGSSGPDPVSAPASNQDVAKSMADAPLPSTAPQSGSQQVGPA